MTKTLRKKPVIVKAVQYTFDNLEEISQFIGDSFRIVGGKPAIETLEGLQWITVGDWVIRGVKGEFYPCKPDIKELTYDEVDDD